MTAFNVLILLLGLWGSLPDTFTANASPVIRGKLRARQNSRSSLSLPLAPIGILGAGNTVVDDRWLIIGGISRTIAGQQGLNDPTYVNDTYRIANSIQVLNLNNGNVSEVSAQVPDGVLNRMGIRSQTCDYDNVETKLVYCFGGLPATSQKNDFVENIGVLDPSNMQWQDEISTDNLKPRQGHSSVLLNGEWYIFGGIANTLDANQDSAPQPLSTLHSFNTKSHDITSHTPSNGPSARVYHCAAALNNTAFVVIGGTNGSQVIGEAWVYNTGTSQWTNVSGQTRNATLVNRGGHACVWTPSGVVVSGGYNSDFTLLDDIWLLNTTTLSARQLPSQNSNSNNRNSRRQSSSSSSPAGRAFHQMAAIGNYTVISGGETTFNATINDWVAGDSTVHFYDPRNGSLGYLTTVPFGASLRAAYVPGQNASNVAANSDNDDDDHGSVVGKVFAGICGILGLFFLCCAWAVAIKHYRKGHHHHHVGTGIVHHDHHRASMIGYPTDATRIATPATASVVAANRSPARSAPMQQTSAVAAAPTNRPANTLSTSLIDAIVPAAAASLTADQRNQHQQPQHHHVQQHHQTPRPTIPTRTPTIPHAGSSTTGAIEQPSTLFNPTTTSAQPQPSGSLNVVPSTATATAMTDLEHANLGGSTANAGDLYRILWAHNPQQPDELNVQPGDVVQERRAFADGWMLVKDGSGRCGMIPRNILRPLQ